MIKKISPLILSVLLLFGLTLPAFADIRTDLRSEFYYRYGTETGKISTFDLPGVELNPQITLTGDSGDLLTLAFQIYAGGSMHGAMKEMHYSNAYLIIPTGLGKPTLKFGYQIIPFGQLAEYDTHSQIMQNLYAKSLGLRIDNGASIFGMLGGYDFWLMFGNGNGPRADNDENKAISGRIAGKYQIGNADLRLGLSALHGNLPYYELGKDVFQIHSSQPVSNYIETKTRYALDVELSTGLLLIRSEGVAGQNELNDGITTTTDNAFGYYTEVRYPIFNNLEVVAKYDYWRPYELNNESVTSMGLGLNYSINKNLELQLVAERFLNNVTTVGVPELWERITLQIGASL